MTWNGLQGFQTPIQPDNFIVENMGSFGQMRSERNITCAHASVPVCLTVC